MRTQVLKEKAGASFEIEILFLFLKKYLIDEVVGVYFG